MHLITRCGKRFQGLFEPIDVNEDSEEDGDFELEKEVEVGGYGFNLP